MEETRIARKLVGNFLRGECREAEGERGRVFLEAAGRSGAGALRGPFDMTRYGDAPHADELWRLCSGTGSAGFVSSRWVLAS